MFSFENEVARMVKKLPASLPFASGVHQDHLRGWVGGWVVGGFLHTLWFTNQINSVMLINLPTISNSISVPSGLIFSRHKLYYFKFTDEFCILPIQLTILAYLQIINETAVRFPDLSSQFASLQLHS